MADKKPIKLLFVEDDLSYQKRMLAYFELMDEVEVLFACDSGEEALEWLHKTTVQPEVILMDIHLRGITGIETCSKIKHDFPDMDIMMLTMFEEKEKIFQSIQSGATGYVLKEDSPDFILQSISELHQGGSPISGSVAGILMQFVKNQKLDSNPKTAEKPSKNLHAEHLSDRELEILQLLVDGQTYTDIASHSYISPHTVKTHIKNIYRKIHVNSRASAVRYALKNRLV
ncbi:response regulator transcription factor [bacterium]|nr:MAG: response regulator transcription factor [bacterium]